MQTYLALIICIAICELAGLIGSLFVRRSVGSWYLNLRKPNFTPKSAYFGIIWTILYLLMGISLYIVIIADGKSLAWAIFWFFMQLFLNILWSYLFFYRRNIKSAFFDTCALWVSIFITLILFWRISILAGLLMIPYLAWVSFAAILNYSIWKLNR